MPLIVARAMVSSEGGKMRCSCRTESMEAIWPISFELNSGSTRIVLLRLGATSLARRYREYRKEHSGEYRGLVSCLTTVRRCCVVCSVIHRNDIQPLSQLWCKYCCPKLDAA